MKKIIFSLSLIISLHSWGQNQGEIETHEIKIVKDYNVYIEEASKLYSTISYNPKFKESTNQQKLTYKLPDRIEQFKFQTSNVEYLPYQSKDLLSYNNSNYLKLGVGSILNPILEWSHVSTKSNNPSRIYLNHHSAFKATDSLQSYSHTNFDFNKKINRSNWTITPSIKINHKFYSFYGNINESINKTEATRNYLLTEGGLSLNKEKFELKSMSIYNEFNANFGMDNLAQVMNTNGQNFEFLGKASNQLSYKYNDNFKLNLNSKGQYYNLRFDTFTDKWLVSTMPNVEYKTKTLKLNVGLDFVQTLVNSKDLFYIMPKLESELQLVPNKVNFYSLWERKIDMNMMQSHINQNPYLIYDNNVLPNTKIENRGLGIRGNVKNFSFHGFFLQKVMKDAILFKNVDQEPRFMISTIEKNMTQGNAELELNYIQKDKFGAYLKGDIFIYEFDDPSKIAHNLPGQKLTAGFQATLNKKIKLNTNIYAIGGVKSRINGLEKLNPIAFDLNLGAEYQISKNFYIFANANNILNSKIATQIGYTSYGVNGQGGFRFCYK